MSRIAEAEGMNMMSGPVSLNDISNGNQPIEAVGPTGRDNTTEIEDPIDTSVRGDLMGDDKFHVEGEEPEVTESEESSEESSEEQPEVPEVEVTAFKQKHKFKLDPSDKELQSTLKKGLFAQKLQSQLDKTTAELTALRGQTAEVTERAQVWDELRELHSQGHYEEIARLVLDDKFDALRNAIIEEYEISTNGSPDERHALEMARRERDKKWALEQVRKENERLAKELDARDDAVREKALRTHGEAMMRKYDMSQFMDDPNEAQEANDDLWELAWSKLSALGEDVDPTPRQIEQAFAQVARRMRGGRQKVINSRVQEATNRKREQAKIAAKTAATAKYPVKADDDRLKNWNGRTAKSFFDTLGI